MVKPLLPNGTEFNWTITPSKYERKKRLLWLHQIQLVREFRAGRLTYIFLLTSCCVGHEESIDLNHIFTDIHPRSTPCWMSMMNEGETISPNVDQ
jgi:hypothetical protein